MTFPGDGTLSWLSHTETLQRQLEDLLKENERYRKIGAAYRLDADDPLLAVIRRDLDLIASPPSQEAQVLAVEKLPARGEGVVPRLIYLVNDHSRFDYGELTIGKGSTPVLGAAPITRLPLLTTQAISDLLSYKTGVYMGSQARYGSELIDQNAIDGWHTYLGRLLANDPPQSN